MQSILLQSMFVVFCLEVNELKISVTGECQYNPEVMLVYIFVTVCEYFEAIRGKQSGLN